MKSYLNFKIYKNYNIFFQLIIFFCKIQICNIYIYIFNFYKNINFFYIFIYLFKFKILFYNLYLIFKITFKEGFYYIKYLTLIFFVDTLLIDDEPL